MSGCKSKAGFYVGIAALLWLLVPLGLASAQEGTAPESAYVIGVVGNAQSYTLSCESRSAVDWAAFWGVSIDESEFQSALPSSDNPDSGFVGYPNDPWGYIPPRSYGVYAEPVADLLRQYGVRARPRRGLKWHDLKAEIAAGRPVIVWIIGQMWSGVPVSYTASDGNTTTVARFEHTIILVGYDSSVVHVVDAYSGWTQTYTLEAFLESWSVLGNMAILGRGKPPAQPMDSSGDTYLVQRGDYLIALARQFNISWQQLAKINSIPYPYTIYPGQALKLPGGGREAAGEPQTTSTPERPKKKKESTGYSILLPFVLSQSGPTAKATQLPTPEEAQPEYYTVQRGDFLVALAERFNLDWRELADLNDLYYPYIIYPGQLLRLH